MFDMDGIDALLEGGARPAPKLGYFVEIALRDAEGNELLKLTGESEARPDPDPDPDPNPNPNPNLDPDPNPNPNPNPNPSLNPH